MTFNPVHTWVPSKPKEESIQPLEVSRARRICKPLRSDKNQESKTANETDLQCRLPLPLSIASCPPESSLDLLP